MDKDVFEWLHVKGRAHKVSACISTARRGSPQMLIARVPPGRRRISGAVCACARVVSRACTTGTKNYRIDGIKQGGTLVVRLCKPVATNIRVTSAWIDHVEIVHPPMPSSALRIEVDEAKQTVAILEPHPQPGAKPGAPMKVHVVVPEKFALDVAVGKGDVKVKGKVEGNVRLTTDSGNIRVSKLRGESLVLEAKGGRIDVERFMEGNMRLAAACLHAKMLKGHEVRVDVRGDPPPFPAPPPSTSTSPSQMEGERAPVWIEAIYGNRASIACMSYPMEEAEALAVRVGRSHGALTVVVQGGGVSLGGVNGSAQVLGGAGALDVQIEALERSEGSVLTTSTGPVNVHVAPDVRARVEVESLGPPSHSYHQLHHGPINAAALTNFVKKEATGRKMRGVLTGITPEPSRAAGLVGGVRQGGHASGKIDLGGAHDQALRMYFEGEGKGADGQMQEDLPTLRVQSQQGNMTLRTLSWMDAIKRQFGLTHVDYNVPIHGPKHGGRKK